MTDEQAGQPVEQEMPVAGKAPEPVDGTEPALVSIDVVAEAGVPAAETYTGEQWTAEAMRLELVRRDVNRTAADEFMPQLSQFVLERMPQEIDPTRGEVDAVSIVIRVLETFLDHPGGRLEPAVREALHQLDAIPAALPVAEFRGELELIRGRLVEALTAPPRPGGGPAPVYESDDITMVRFDRDRFRTELNMVCVTLAQMYAAATGRQGMAYEVGPVEDLQVIRFRLKAAEEALTNALRHRCDLTEVMPRPGTPQYEQLAKLVADIMRSLAAAEVQRVGWTS